jgi:hypothetical protein
MKEIFAIAAVDGQQTEAAIEAVKNDLERLFPGLTPSGVLTHESGSQIVHKLDSDQGAVLVDEVYETQQRVRDDAMASITQGVLEVQLKDSEASQLTSADLLQHPQFISDCQTITGESPCNQSLYDFCYQVGDQVHSREHLDAICEAHEGSSELYVIGVACNGVGYGPESGDEATGIKLGAE